MNKFQVTIFFWVFYSVAWFKKRIFGVFKTISSLFVVPVIPGANALLLFIKNAFWKFLRLENSVCYLLRAIFGPGIFLNFVGSPRDFLRFWFLQPIDHPPHLKSRVLPGLPLGFSTNLVQWRRDEVRGTSCPSSLKLNWRFQPSFRDSKKCKRFFFYFFLSKRRS